MISSAELGEMEDDMSRLDLQNIVLRKEIARLRAEVEGLREEKKIWDRDEEIYVRITQTEADEFDGLRKIAARYRWLTERNGGPIGIVAWHKDEDKEMVLVEQYADAAIDAAMGEGK